MLDRDGNAGNEGLVRRTSPLRDHFAGLLATDVVCGVRQESQVAGSLDRNRKASLVPGAGADLAAGADRATIRQEALEQVHALVVDDVVRVFAERTDLGAPAKSAAAPSETAAIAPVSAITPPVLAALAAIAALPAIAALSSLGARRRSLFGLRGAYFFVLVLTSWLYQRSPP